MNVSTILVSDSTIYTYPDRIPDCVPFTIRTTKNFKGMMLRSQRKRQKSDYRMNNCNSYRVEFLILRLKKIKMKILIKSKLIHI